MNSVYKKVLLLLFLSGPSFGFIPKKFSSVYEETHTKKLSGKTVTNQGQLVYAFPGKIKIIPDDKLSPIFYSNGKTSWLYTPPFSSEEKGQVKVGSSGHFKITSILDTLNQGLTSNKDYEIKKDKKNNIEVVMGKTLQEQLKLKKVDLLAIEGKSIERLQDVKELGVHYLSGEKKIFRFLKIKEIEKIQESDFSFNAPANTEILAIE